MKRSTDLKRYFDSQKTIMIFCSKRNEHTKEKVVYNYNSTCIWVLVETIVIMILACIEGLVNQYVSSYPPSLQCLFVIGVENQENILKNK